MGASASQREIVQLVEEFYESLYRYAYRLSGSATDAEDLAQDTFCKAQSQWEQLRDRSRVRSWLFSILRNAYLYHVRSERTQKLVSLENMGDFPEASSPEPAFEVDANALQVALNELPEVYRTPIILYYFEDFSYRDIADQMELPIGTVMSRLARAKAFLRQRLEPKLEPTLAPNAGRA
jgi:RNA polymerase sigma-70 factor (ECF subfamily)